MFRKMVRSGRLHVHTDSQRGNSDSRGWTRGKGFFKSVGGRQKCKEERTVATESSIDDDSTKEELRVEMCSSYSGSQRLPNAGESQSQDESQISYASQSCTDVGYDQMFNSKDGSLSSTYLDGIFSDESSEVTEVVSVLSHGSSAKIQVKFALDVPEFVAKWFSEIDSHEVLTQSVTLTDTSELFSYSAATDDTDAEEPATSRLNFSEQSPEVDVGVELVLENSKYSSDSARRSEIQDTFAQVVPLAESKLPRIRIQHSQDNIEIELKETT